MEITEKELCECRVQLQQNDVRNRSLQETMNEQSERRRALEIELDTLRGSLAAGGNTATASGEHLRQISAMRSEIAEKSRQIEQLTVGDCNHISSFFIVFAFF